MVIWTRQEEVGRIYAAFGGICQSVCGQLKQACQIFRLTAVSREREREREREDKTGALEGNEKKDIYRINKENKGDEGSSPSFEKTGL